MPASPSDLFACLDRLDIAHLTLSHPPAHTVADSYHIKTGMPGGHSKNLFMCDRDGNLFLISAWRDSVLKLNRLHKHIGTRRLSFAPAERLITALGVKPGSVTAFALINDKARRVRFIADSTLMAFDTVCFHPLTNTATTAINGHNLRRFVAATGHALTEIDFTRL